MINPGEHIPDGIGPEELQPPSEETLATVSEAFDDLRPHATGYRSTLVVETFANEQHGIQASVRSYINAPIATSPAAKLTYGSALQVEVRTASDRLSVTNGDFAEGSDNESMQARLDQVIQGQDEPTAQWLDLAYKTAQRSHTDQDKFDAIKQLEASAPSPSREALSYIIPDTILPSGRKLTGLWSEGDTGLLQLKSLKDRRFLVLTEPDGTKYMYRQPIDGQTASLLVEKPGLPRMEADEDDVDAIGQEHQKMAELGVSSPTEKSMTDFADALNAAVAELADTQREPTSETRRRFESLVGALDAMSNMKLEKGATTVFKSPDKDLLVEVSGSHTEVKRLLQEEDVSWEEPILHVSLGRSQDDIAEYQGLSVGNVFTTSGELEARVIDEEVESIASAASTEDGHWLRTAYAAAKEFTPDKFEPAESEDIVAQELKAAAITDAEAQLTSLIDSLAQSAPQYAYSFNHFNLPSAVFADGSELVANAIRGDAGQIAQVYNDRSSQVIELTAGDGTNYYYTVDQYGVESLAIKRPGPRNPDDILESLTIAQDRLDNGAAPNLLFDRPPSNEATMRMFCSALEHALNSGQPVRRHDAKQYMASAAIRPLLQASRQYNPKDGHPN